MLTEIVFVVFVCFFTVSVKATHCSYNSECSEDSQTCCPDGICRETCFFCSNDFQCGSGECCDSHGDCKSDCGIATEAIIAIVVGCVLIGAMVVSFVACLCCSSCPYCRRRHPAVVVHPSGYQQVTTRPLPQRSRLIRTVRRLQPGLIQIIERRTTSESPPPSEYNLLSAEFNPPTDRHGEPPPPYSPLPQTGSYPSSQAEDTAPYPPTEATGPATYPPLQVQLPETYISPSNGH